MFSIEFLGTGTSTGVPQIGCSCQTCTSSDSRDRRLRASALVHCGDKNILIDCGPDFRYQMLRAGSPRLDALLVTHSHYDHVGGIDDLRPYCHPHSFPVYCREDVAEDLRNRVPYCFAKHLYPGVPTFDIHVINPNEKFTVAGIEITPLPVMHAALPIVGFRIGTMAYITDCKTLPPETEPLLGDLDVLVINALRPQPHMSHLSISEALSVIARVKPRRAYLTHVSHDTPPYRQISRTLPDNVEYATDGLCVDISRL